MEEEQISGSTNSFSDRYNPNDYSSHDEEEKEEESSHDHRSNHAPILVDRISALPDSILLSILCFLTINDAIKTGVLSKRWASLWTSLPSLSFDSLSFRHLEDFTNAVDDTLLLHRAPKLTNFDIRVNHDYETKLNPRLDLWVRFATNAKVEQLSLHLWPPHSLDPNGYQLPQHLYANEFVSEFNFSFCKIFPTGLLRWSSLKRLSIGHSALCEDVIRKVLMGSPRLESLELHDCYGFHRLDIVSESLRKLVVDSYLIDMLESEERQLELEIVAPKIECLEILGCFRMKKCRIKDVSALVEAKLDFNMRNGYGSDEEEGACEEYQDIVRDILESVHHVKKLTVGHWCLMVVSIMSMEHLPSPLSKCQCLTMKTDMEKENLPGIARLLQSSPFVETLSMNVTSSYSYYIGSEFLKGRCRCSYHDEVKHWKSGEIYFKSLLVCLKTVNIFGFGERLFHRKEEFILVVQFLLQNAKVLEKMVITTPWDMQNERSILLLKFLKVGQKLLSFPRSSPHAVIMFPYL
ncbi:putative F-box protein At1g49610 [Quercus suber]|uniref:putative F-box protein At1g49610 n=1 Tax=Quercus suber TaxID=58331 RepID=UPI0032DEB869